MARALPLDVDDEAFAAFADTLLPQVALELRSAVWAGLVTAEPAAGPDEAQARRARLEHPARLRVDATGRLYALAAHLFEAVGEETALHDHRYPLAVFPFAVDDDVDSPLYEMTWVDARRGAGATRVVVRPGALWAVTAPGAVRHTVKSLRPHASIVVADVTAAPSRPARLAAAALPPGEVRRVRRIVRDALGRAIADRLPRQWHLRMALEPDEPDELASVMAD